MVHYTGDVTNIEAAYSALADIETTVAQASITLIPGETQFDLTALHRLRDPAPPADPGRPATKRSRTTTPRSSSATRTSSRSTTRSNYIQQRVRDRRLPRRPGALLRPLRHRAARLTFEQNEDRLPGRDRDQRQGQRRRQPAGPSTSSTGHSPCRFDQTQLGRVRPAAVQLPGPLPARPGQLQGQHPLEEHGLQGVHHARGRYPHPRPQRLLHEPSRSWPTGRTGNPSIAGRTRPSSSGTSNTCRPRTESSSPATS